MPKKALLSESQIRKFMKLAQLEPLVGTFVNEMDLRQEEEEEELEEVRTGHGGNLDDARRGHGRGTGPEDRLEEMPVEDELETDVELAPDELPDVEDEEPEMPVEPEEEVVDDVGLDVGKTVSVEDFLAALETALENVMGDEVEIDSEEMVEPEEEVVDDAELDAEAELPVPEEEMVDDELMESITKRVAARILKEALKIK